MKPFCLPQLFKDYDKFILRKIYTNVGLVEFYSPMDHWVNLSNKILKYNDCIIFITNQTTVSILNMNRQFDDKKINETYLIIQY